MVATEGQRLLSSVMSSTKTKYPGKGTTRKKITSRARRPAKNRAPRGRTVEKVADKYFTPQWKDLVNPDRRTNRGQRRLSFLDDISTKKFAALILLIAGFFTLYVGHVQATQNELANVQRLRRENLRYHLEYNRLKGDFDRLVGPAALTERAKGLGLEEGIEYGPTIYINQ